MVSEDTEGVRAVRRAVRCLRLLAGRSEAVTLSEISEDLGLAASTAHRLLATLQSEGLVEHQPGTRRYRISAAIIGLAMRPLLDEERLRHLGHPILEGLLARTSETVHLAVLRGPQVVTIEEIESPHTLLVRHPPGMMLPAHATALGMALVAYRPEIAAALVSAGLRRLTPYTITDADQFEAELRFVREIGYARNERQRNADTAGVAAPVFQDAATPVAAIGVSGPASRVHGDVIPFLGQEARNAAEALTAQLRSDGAPEPSS